MIKLQALLTFIFIDLYLFINMVKFRFIKTFIDNMNEKPFRYIPITGFVTSFIGDVLCQIIIHRKKRTKIDDIKENIDLNISNMTNVQNFDYNFKRSINQGCGSVITSPLNIFQNVIVIPFLFPNNSKYRVVKSVIYTSFVIVPSQQYLLFNYFSLVHFGFINSKYVKAKHRDAYITYLKYIVPLVTFSFMYFTPVMRMLFAQLFSILWNAYISLISNQIELTANYM